MIILVPRYLIAPAMGLFFLMGIMMGCGFLTGIPVIILFTAPRLLEKLDLLFLPAVVVSGLILYFLSRQLRRNVNSDPEGLNLFRQAGGSAWFVFVLMASAYIGGLCLSGYAARDERISRASMARNANAVPVPGHVTVGQSGLRIQAIFYSPTKPSAVLNGQTLLIGGKVGQWHVSAIEPKSVTVTNAGGEMDKLWLR